MFISNVDKHLNQKVKICIYNNNDSLDNVTICFLVVSLCRIITWICSFTVSLSPCLSCPAATFALSLQSSAKEPHVSLSEVVRSKSKARRESLLDLSKWMTKWMLLCNSWMGHNSSLGSDQRLRPLHRVDLILLVWHCLNFEQFSEGGN